ncbi:KdsC family phosphatase [Xanthomonas albilineans]|uniref:KdsC family phosphatase n=1 Tax=Xanthomonas albilineans TaxID=29447 RepID=UPI0005F333EE|nr:HAD hydrolase family protein [Xanthomonas albilineans]PPU91622.1 phenylphosphate carboxylase subunit delta [Xanthomonas albilineans]
MSYSPLADLPAELIDRATRIRLACFDVDGTLTDGRLYYDRDGNESKAFHVQDGQGLVQLRKHGIEVALITARHSLAAEKRGQELGLLVQIGVQDKRASVQALCDERGLRLEQVCFMGDDLPDVTALRAVGLAVAPANAHPWTAEHAHWITQARGGEGAARELCDVLLAAQGHLPFLLQEHGA